MPLPEPELPERDRSLLHFDQLGLANPDVLTVRAKVGLFGRIALDSGASGIYRPAGFRPTPWSGFSYDLASDPLSGIAADARVLTARGEVAVKDLLPGDEALCLRQLRFVAIAWIGRRTTAGVVVTLQRGSLGNGLPRRSLGLAAGQGVFIDSAPVAAGDVPGSAAIRHQATDLFQICVGCDDVLLVEGVPVAVAVRTMSDTGDRPLSLG